MIEIKIPGFGTVKLKHLVSDFTGTLSFNGKLISGVEPANANGHIRCRSQLAGTLRYYHRDTA